MLLACRYCSDQAFQIHPSRAHTPPVGLAGDVDGSDETGWRAAGDPDPGPAGALPGQDGVQRTISCWLTVRPDWSPTARTVQVPRPVGAVVLTVNVPWATAAAGR